MQGDLLHANASVDWAVSQFPSFQSCPQRPGRRGILRSPRGLPERLRQPRDFDGDPSRLVLRQHHRPPRFGFAPSGVDVCERLPVGVVNPVRRPAAMRNISERMEHVIARADRRAAHQVGGDRVSDALSQVEAVGDDGL